MNLTSLPPSMPTGGGTSYFSSIGAPSVLAESWEWQRRYTAVTIGTVLVTVDEATNQTVTSTSYNTDHLSPTQSGTSNQTLHSRTDTNAAGTVTDAIYGADGTSTIVTYPTNVLNVATRFTWDAILPTFTANGSCCLATSILSSAPSHEPIPVKTASTISDDPRGWLYELVPVHDITTDISEFWGSRTFGVPYHGCSHSMCSNTLPPSPPAYSYTWQEPQAYLLATSTTTLSSISMGGDGGGGTAEPQQGPTTTSRVTSPEPDHQGSGTPTTPPSRPDHTPDNDGSSGGQSPPTHLTPVITIGPSTVTANSASQYIVGDQTLEPGSAIEMSGTTYSLASGGSPPVIETQAPNTPAGALPPLTVGDSAVTANSASQYVVDGQTLSPGSAIVVSGTTISMASGGSQVVVGTSTITEPSMSTSGSGGSSTSPSSTATDQSAGSRGVQVSSGKMCMFLGVGLLLMA